MTQELILLPVVVLAIWTMLVLLLIPYNRFRAVFKGELTAGDFKLGESNRVSELVMLPNRNFMNLLEVPILFYVACLTYYIVQVASMTTLTLAWLYVGLRVAHSVCHLTYNNVIHRLSIFAVSNFILVALLIMLALPIVQLTGLLTNGPM